MAGCHRCSDQHCCNDGLSVWPSVSGCFCGRKCRSNKTAAKEAEIAEAVLAREETEEEEEEEEEERDPEAPILELTDDHIYLRVGERFNYMSYIKTMEDVDGSDLSHYIYLNKDVDTDEPGEIDLTYRITSTITGKSDSKVLKITIQE